MDLGFGFGFGLGTGKKSPIYLYIYIYNAKENELYYFKLLVWDLRKGSKLVNRLVESISSNLSKEQKTKLTSKHY